MAFRKQLFTEMGYGDEWCEDINEDLIFLRLVRENLENKIKEFEREVKMSREMGSFGAPSRQ